ncbi:MAG: outer membrane protein assembly factor BamB, partial [Pirellulaceae bacterium]
MLENSVMVQTRFRYCVAFLVLSLSTSVLADWPTYLHDNSRVGATDQPLPKSMTLQWVFHSPVSPQRAWEGPRSEPIEGKVMKHRVGFDDAYHVTVAGDRAYFASTVEHVLYCVDRNTGAVNWRFFTEGPVRLAPTLNDGLVYFGSDDGVVYCLSGDSGKVVWKHRVAPKDERLLARGQMISRWPVRTSVLIDGGISYFGAGIFPHETIYLAAANAKSGEILWKEDAISQEDAGRNDLSPQGYLLAHGDLLFVPSGRTLPAAFEKATGKFVFKKSYGWRNSAGGVVGGAKAMIANGQLYSAGANHFLGLDEETGNAGAAFIKGRQMTFRGEIGYVLTGEKIIAVDQQAHAKASVERKSLYAALRSLSSNREKLKKAKARMLELENAGIQWEQPFTGEGALVLAGNAVVAGGIGVVKVFDIEKGTLMHEAKVDGETRGLSIANGHLFVSTNAGKVYAYAESATTQPPAIWPNEYTKSPYAKDEMTATYESAARDILKNSQVDSGFCLVLGSQRGRLAYELAKRAPKLTLVCLEQDEKLVAESRKILTDAGLYGHRIKVFQAAPDKSPLSNYFANLVVSDSMLIDAALPTAGVELGRFIKPCGGIACLGYPANVNHTQTPDQLSKEVAKMYLRDDSETETIDNWVVLKRGKLAGAGEWSHQYGNVANTSLSEDYRVKGALGVLWYGDPGPSQMINRHEAASAPLSTNGRFFVQGTDNIRAFDAYNGEFLWEHKNPGAIRTGVFNNYETSNLAASDDSLFVAAAQQCTVYNAATGKVEAELKAPQSDDGIERDWGYLAYHDNLVYGTST